MSFNNLGNYTIASGASFRFDGWSWSAGNGDHGAQYFSAHPIDPSRDAQLIISDQSKTLGTDGHYSYGFRITNHGPLDAHFSVQGGGYS
ncbi:MAG: hypothetical protein JWO06_946 [Bacteroidota bacterium]|nr:hypothetical protein [Bacteroidota bacterium]